MPLHVLTVKRAPLLAVVVVSVTRISSCFSRLEESYERQQHQSHSCHLKCFECFDMRCNVSRFCIIQRRVMWSDSSIPCDGNGIANSCMRKEATALSHLPAELLIENLWLLTQTRAMLSALWLKEILKLFALPGWWLSIKCFYLSCFEWIPFSCF